MGSRPVLISSSWRRERLEMQAERRRARRLNRAVLSVKEITMTTQQGSIELLNDPVAQQMLQSTGPARFAYNWTDGTPRVVPIGFHWNGAEIVLGTPTDAAKTRALHEGD